MTIARDGRAERRRTFVPFVSAISLGMIGVIAVTAWIALRRPFAGFFFVRGTGTVAVVFSGTPAANAGLERGDVVLAVGGQPTTAVARSFVATSDIALGETMAVTVARDGHVRSLGLPMVPPTWLARLHRLELPVIAFCFVLFGFFVWAHKPYDPTVIRFLVFTYCVAALHVASSLVAFSVPWAFLAFDLFLALSSATALHFLLVFPQARAFRGRRWALAGIYGLALCPPLLYLPSLGQEADIEGYFLALDAARLCSGAALLIGTWLLLHTYRTTPSEEARRRIRLVVGGTVLGCAPIVALSVLPEVFDRTRAFYVPYELTLPFLLLIPLSYGIAIQRYDLLRLERLVNRGVVNLVVLSILAVVYVSVVVGLPRLWPWMDRPLARGLVALLVALLFGPMRDRLQRLADRVFYGGWYDYGSVLGEMTQALAGVVDAETLARVLGGRLAEVLHLRGAALLLSSGEGGVERVTGGWPGDTVPRLLPRTGAVAIELLRAARPLSTAELVSASSATTPSEDERRWLSSLEIELWVPIVRRGALQGVLLLGTKPGGEPFDAEDRRLLGSVAWSAAVAVENVQLFSALRRRADEINRLYLQLLQSREEERKRLARELHDRVIQDLINLHYFIEIAPAEPTLDQTHTLRQGLRDVIDKLRKVSTELRPPALDDLDLGLAMQGYVEEVRVKHGLRVSLRLPSDGSERLETLPEEARLGLFRVLQEALTNVYRHAGASRVEVELLTRPGEVTLEVRDDGRGFACPEELGALIRSGHFGLAGAHERMALIGGTLELASERGAGTRLRASVPFSKG